MNILKNLTKKKEATGALSGKVVRVGPYQLKVEALIGEGGFASIYRAIDMSTRQTFALKHFMLSGDPEAECDVQTEVAVMKALSSCPYTLQLHGFAFGAGEAFVLVDYCVGTLAAQLNNRQDPLSTAEVINMFLPVCRGVLAMHTNEPPLAHRDVKAENVLLHPDGSWVLCDFGSASRSHGILESAIEISREEERVRKQTTPAYRAPELWDLYTRQPLGLSVDIWALGCLLYLLCYGRLPFENEAKLQVLNGVYTIPSGSRPPMLEQLIRDMLVVDPLQRITADQVVARLTGGSSSAAAAPSPASNTAGTRSNADAWKSGFGSDSLRQHQRPLGAGMAMAESRSSTASGSNGTAPLSTAAAGSGSGGLVGQGAPLRQAASTIQHQTQQTQYQEAAAEGWATFGSGSPRSQPGSPVTRPTTTVTAAAGATAVSGSRSSSRGTESQPSSSSRPSSSQDNTATTGTLSGEASRAASSAAGAVSTATAAATAQLQSLQLRENELQEHCQVLEQLLEGKKYEVDALRSRMKDQDEELRRLRVKALDVDDLRNEVATLKAEMERLKKQQKGAGPSHIGSSSSASGSGTGSVGLASFPLGNGGDMSTPGQPMRPGGGGVSHARTNSSSRPMAFDDLNPF